MSQHIPDILRSKRNAGDVNKIDIGEDTNVQDGAIIHVAKNNAGGRAIATSIGNKVTIGKKGALPPLISPFFGPTQIPLVIGERQGPC